MSHRTSYSPWSGTLMKVHEYKNLSYVGLQVKVSCRMKYILEVLLLASTVLHVVTQQREA